MRRTVFILFATATPLLAQQQQSARDANVGVSAARAHWLAVHNQILRTAEQLPESLYSFRATPEVRSFAGLLGHIAGSEFMFCSMARGDKQREEDAIEKTKKTKAELVQALKDAAAYCEPAYSMSDATAAGMVDVFGRQQTKLYALFFNALHDGEHYGNLVTYLRLNRLVPPSSQP